MTILMMLPWLLLAAPVQEPEVPVAMSGNSAEAQFSDPQTRELFERAVATQTPNGSAPEILDFQADFEVSLYEREGQGPKSGSITEFWRRKGKVTQYRRILSIPGGATTNLATDGQRFQMWERGSKVVHDLTSDPAFKEDLAQLKEERRRTEELIELFFLSNLAGDGTTFRRGAEFTVDAGGRAATPVVEIIREKQGEPLMALLIGREDHRLYGVRIEPVSPESPGEEFRFGFHRELEREAADGAKSVILMPTRVEYHQNGRKLVEASTNNPGNVKFNVGLTDESFRPPSRR